MGVLGLTAQGLEDFSELPARESPDDVVTEAAIQPEEGGDLFTEVGYGLPLTVRIERIYTGKFPKLRRRKKSLLISTAYKSENLSAAASRSLNWIEKKIDKTHASYKTVAAAQEGTNLVYAKAAVDLNAIVLTIDLAFDDFNDEAYGQVAGALNDAAAIPVLAVAAPYLLIAGQLVNLGSRLGNRLVDRGPDISLSVPLFFRRGGRPAVKKGRLAVVSEEFHFEARNLYTVSDDDLLVSKADPPQAYTGDQPYVILSLDGAPLPEELKDFAPTLLTATQLKRFLDVREDQDANADLVVAAFKIYNDYDYRRRADKKKAQLAAPNLSDADKARLEKELKAMVDNIVSDELKPS